MKFLIGPLIQAFTFLKFRRKPYGAFNVEAVSHDTAQELLAKGFVPVWGDVQQAIVLFRQ